MLFLFQTYTYAQELPDSSAVPVLTATHTDVTCNGGQDGSITIQVTGGKTPYQYSRDRGNSWQTAPRFEGLYAGDYAVLVQDSTGLMAAAYVTVQEPPPIQVEVTTQAVTCHGSGNGSIQLKASGGKGNYLYSKDKGVTWQPSPRFNDVAPGEYGVLARDQNGCMGGTYVTISEPPAFTMRITKKDASCFGFSDGSIQVVAEGGFPPYQYSNNNGLTWQDNPLFDGISAGMYPVLVKDSGLCMLSENVTLTEPSLLSIQSVESVYDSSHFSVTINATGGVPAYTYSVYPVSGWQPNNRFDSLAIGYYTLFVKDQQACLTGRFVTLAASKVLEMKIESWNASCYQSANAAINIKIKGGAAPYQYSADSGATWQNNANFLRRAGNYHVIARDRADNRVGAKVVLGEPALLTARLEGYEVSCRGAANGRIVVVAAGGVPPYKYSINQGATWQSNPEFTGLPGGDYTIYIQDAFTCAANGRVQLREPDRLALTGEGTAATCYDKADGSLRLQARGGTEPYKFSNDGGLSWQGNAQFSGLKAALHPLWVMDRNGCKDSVLVQVQQPAQLSLNPAIQTVSCYGLADGRITLSPRGGTTPYTVKMDNGAWQTDTRYDSLSPGTFVMMVKDGNGCTFSSNIKMTQPDSLALALVSAKNGCSYIGGQLEVKANGGTLPYRYTLSGSTDSTDNGLFAALGAGRYTPVVTDKNGCLATARPVNIEISPEIRLVLDEKADMQCDGIHKGSARLHAEGGIFPYRFSINEKPYQLGSTGPLDNGAYAAIVQDKNGCAAEQRFDIALLNEGCELTMPTGFSPNDDGMNDIFRPALYGNIRNYQMQLFNSWGNLLFSSKDPEAGWDGSFKGHRQAVATYVWIVQYINYLGLPVVRRGAVTLVR